QILQNQKLLRCLDLSKLPDRGQRLKDQIAKLEIELTEMKLRKPAEEIGMIKNRPPPVIQRPSEHRGPILIDLTDDTSISRNAFNETNPRNHADNYYGGRMTVNRLNVVTKVTTEAIEILHSSLETCPPSSNEESDPEGLKVELMTHQRQALAWMIWREKQSVSGGILADDMGLGKTLTMISLILKQLQIVTKEETKDPDSDDGIDSIVDSIPVFPSDSTVIIAPASLIFHWRNEIKNRCDKGLLSIHLYHGKDRERDAEKLAEFDVVITTYDIGKLRTHPKAEKDKDGSINDKGSNSLEHALFLIKWRRVILDEAHQIRNHKSQTSIAACALHAHSRWAMSGTPVQNQEADMYAMIRFLHCSPFDEHKLWKNQVNNNTERGQQRLRTLVSCLRLKDTKNQRGANGKPLVNLPSRTFKLHKLKLNPIEREVIYNLVTFQVNSTLPNLTCHCTNLQVYDKLKSDSQVAYKNYEREKQNPSGCQVYNPEESKKMTATTLLVMLLRLRQCCGHLHLLQGSFDPELLQKEKEDIAVEDLFQSMNIGGNIHPLSLDFLLANRLRNNIDRKTFLIPAESAYSAPKYSDKSKAKYFEISEPSSKISFVMDTLHKLKDSKNNFQIIVKLTTINQHLSSFISCNVIFMFNFGVGLTQIGIVAVVNRMVKICSWVGYSTKIMLVSLQAGGVGLNLIGGNHLFLLDMHWNPALEKQAFDRIYRVGQKKEVFVHKFIMEDTVEQQILQLQERKLSIAKAVMEGADVDNKVKLTLADMKMLFGI
uniref:Transcription termination factor 2 n=1 Tax=Ciona savignyi TaxID=51511 RepID=H2YHJ4_CIOSA